MVGGMDFRVARGSRDLVRPHRHHRRDALPRRGRAGRGRPGADPGSVPQADRPDARPARPRDAALRPRRDDQRRPGGLGRGPQRPASRTPPHDRGRGHRPHRAPRPDPRRGQRRGGPARAGVQRDADRALGVAGATAPAGRRRRPRAAHAAHLAAHQPRPARPGGRLDAALGGVAQGAARRRARPDHRDDHPDRRPGRAGPRGPVDAVRRAGGAGRRRLPGGHPRPTPDDHRRVRRAHRAVVGHR